MKKNELLEKLQIVNSQGLNATIPVSEIIIMISQLEEAEEETKLILKEELMDDFVDAVIDELNSEGTSLIDDYDLEMSGREVELSSVEYNDSRIRNCMNTVMDQYFTTA